MSDVFVKSFCSVGLSSSLCVCTHSLFARAVHIVSFLPHSITHEALHTCTRRFAQRLMGIVVQEVGTRSTPASEMVLKSFLAWEREIRKELTEPAWEVQKEPRRTFHRVSSMLPHRCTCCNRCVPRSGHGAQSKSSVALPRAHPAGRTSVAVKNHHERN